jgi:hypothetical protein
VNRLLRFFWLAGAFALSATAQTTTTPAFPFTYYVHDTTGTTADYPLPSIYQFTATPLGNSTHVVLKAVNTSSAAAFMGGVYVAASATTTTVNSNFTVTGLASSISVPAGGSLLFQVNFSPTSTGVISAYLDTTYQVQTSGCSFTSTDPTTQCPSGINVGAALDGTATTPQLVLSYTTSGGTSTLLQANTSAPLNFGNVSTSASTTITFTLSNQSSISLSVPSITVPAPTTYSSNPFALNATQVPATLAAGASANFTVTFAPGQTGVVTTAIDVGTNTYPIQGAGIVVADIDALQISYVDSTGVQTLPQAATPINFGQLVAGTGGTASLIFTVSNPGTSYNAVSVSALTVSGAAYSLSGLTGASAFPASIAPGSSIVFTVTFTPSVTGTSTGSLAIGARTFSLTGVAVTSPLPSFSVIVNPSPLSSDQPNATVSVQLASVAALSLTGTLSISFAPSVANVTTDPTVFFVDHSSLTVPISIAAGSQMATYTNSAGTAQTAIGFQTGATAGTITFTVTFPNTPAYTQSFSITPSIVQVTSATAVVQTSQSLLITVNGYDNTYSAGNLNFTFYNTSGTAYPAISYNAASIFQSNFFSSSNTAAGMFMLQATFPVTGDITQIGSVAVSIANSVGQNNQTLTITQ